MVKKYTIDMSSLKHLLLTILNCPFNNIIYLERERERVMRIPTTNPWRDGHSTITSYCGSGDWGKTGFNPLGGKLCLEAVAVPSDHPH